MTSLWYRFCHWLCAKIYYERITVLNPERLIKEGPVLYVGLHRNGAVDGFIYHQAVQRGVFLISTQLRRHFFSRLFFCGISVARNKDDEDSGGNDAAIKECVDLLGSGGALFIFPEGTSSLGPRHLPFKSGAMHIALESLASGVPLRIIPLGIHYEKAWAFRSKVEIVVGNSISTALLPEMSRLGQLKEMKRRMNLALESVGTNFPSPELYKEASLLAYASTLGTARSYFKSLKTFEGGIPEPVSHDWRQLVEKFASRRMLYNQGIPLFPGKPWWMYAASLCLLAPLVLAGVLVNFPPLLMGWFAGKKFSDDRNVIALWRLLIGLPIGLIWSLLVLVMLMFFCRWEWSLGYAVLTLSALRLTYRTKKVAVAVWNGLLHRSISRQAWHFHQRLSENLPNP
jgi:1-acyl-sn-glycerol-3-phosphate acyltransferase